MTLKDIAKEAGVSISTVSRIINGNSSNAASKEMQDKIWSIARAGGYVPNTSAQALKQKNRENVSLHFRVLWNIFIIKRKMEQWFQGMKTDWSRQSIMLRSCISRMRRWQKSTMLSEQPVRTAVHRSPIWGQCTASTADLRSHRSI